MPLPTKTKPQFVSDMVTAFCAALGIEPNLKDGNIFLAFFQAIASGACLFLQSVAQYLSNFARAQTCKSVDLDSWMAQFGFIRLPATFAEGVVTFAVNQVRSTNILIPAGTVVQTVGGATQYQVVADTTKAGWSAANNAYILTAGRLSVDCEVQALAAGSASNVQVGQLTQLASSVPGINSVTNSASILNGDDPETDDEFRQRFVLGFSTPNANGTLAAFLFAASNVQQGLNISIVEDQDQNGNPIQGFVLVIVDDGSGAPPSSLLNSVYSAIDAVRGAGIEIRVLGPILVNVNVTLNIRVASNVSSSQVILNVENAVIDYINSLQIGQTLYISQIEKVAMNADPNVIAIQPGSLSCAQADTTPTTRTVYRTNNTRVTIGTY